MSTSEKISVSKYYKEIYETVRLFEKTISDFTKEVETEGLFFYNHSFVETQYFVNGSSHPSLTFSINQDKNLVFSYTIDLVKKSISIKMNKMNKWFSVLIEKLNETNENTDFLTKYPFEHFTK